MQACGQGCLEVPQAKIAGMLQKYDEDKSEELALTDVKQPHGSLFHTTWLGGGCAAGKNATGLR